MLLYRVSQKKVPIGTFFWDTLYGYVVIKYSSNFNYKLMPAMFIIMARL